MRLTATTGTEIAGSLLQTMRARTYCCTRMPGGRVRSVAFTSIDCVASSARGAMNVIGFEAMTLPSASSSSTVRPGRRLDARSSGTLM